MDKTDQYYRDLKGFSYQDDVVDKWLGRWFFPYVKLPPKAKILDLCCGDGVWGFGIKRRYPLINVFGVDVSQGAIDSAKLRALDYDIPKENFNVHDLEKPLGYPKDSFDIILARGLFIYNQHNFNKDSVHKVMEHWMALLLQGGGTLGIVCIQTEFIRDIRIT